MKVYAIVVTIIMLADSSPNIYFLLWCFDEHLLLFYCVVCFQLGGVGKIRPNTVMMGYKSNWQEDTHEAVDDYVGIIQ